MIDKTFLMKYILIISLFFPFLLAGQIKIGKNPRIKSPKILLDMEAVNGIKVVIDSTYGRVGIGTTTPSKALEVIGVGKFDSLIISKGFAPGKILTSDTKGLAIWQNAPPPTSIPTVNILPNNALEDGSMVYLANNGYYTWSVLDNVWKKIYSLSNTTPLKIPASSSYSANPTQQIFITNIYSESKFDITFTSSCYNRIGRVIGVIKPTTILVEQFFDFVSNGTVNNLSSVINNNSKDVTLGTGSFMSVRLVMNNNVLNWISNSNACGSLNKLSTGTLTNMGNEGNLIPWQVANTNAAYTNGKVGIGTDKPTEILDIIGNIHYSGDIASLSDQRMKKNIELFTDGLNVVEQLNPVRYHYTFEKDSLQKHIGLLAQQVQKVAPYLSKLSTKYVAGENKAVLSLKYNDVILLLVNSVKELAKKNKVIIKRSQKMSLQLAKLNQHIKK